MQANNLLIFKGTKKTCITNFNGKVTIDSVTLNASGFVADVYRMSIHTLNTCLYPTESQNCHLNKNLFKTEANIQVLV